MFKKVLLSSLLLCSVVANEDPTLPVGKIDQLNANYQTPTGSGTAKYINIEEFGEFRNPNLEVDNANGLLIFSVDDKSFELDLSMLGVTDAEAIKLNNVNFQNEGEIIKLNLGSVSATDPEFKINVSSAGINCTRTFIHEDIKDDLLDACLDNGTLTAKNIYFWSKGEEFESLMSEEILGSEVKVSDLKFNIKNGVVRAELKSNLTKNMKVKIEGTSAYDPNGNLITLKITKAKASFLNIKKTLFKEFKKMENENIEVREPYIYITLGDGE